MPDGVPPRAVTGRGGRAVSGGAVGASDVRAAVAVDQQRGSQFEERFCGVIENRLDASDGVVARLKALIGLGENGPGAVAGGGERFLYELKADPGPLGTETFRREVVKLRVQPRYM